MIKAIIFDFFGIFRTDAYKTWLNANSISYEGDYFEVSRQSNLGIISGKEFFDKLSQLAGRAVRAEELEGAVTVDHEVIKIANTLKKKYELALLTNSPVDLISRVLDETNLKSYFTEIVVSSEVGMVKPNIDMFEYIIKKLNVEKDEVIFIDDTLDHVKKARKNDIKSIHFRTAEQLSKELAILKVLI